MNERIQELSKQAWDYVMVCDDRHSKLSTQIFDEKFAELIVRECIVGLENSYSPDDLLPIEEVTGFLKEHFGVE